MFLRSKKLEQLESKLEKTNMQEKLEKIYWYVVSSYYLLTHGTIYTINDFDNFTVKNYFFNEFN